MNLRACAERVERVFRDAGGIVVLTLDELNAVKELYRAVLDVPEDIQAAMDFCREYETVCRGMPTEEYILNRDVNHFKYLESIHKVAQHFLANPIRIDVPVDEGAGPIRVATSPQCGSPVNPSQQNDERQLIEISQFFDGKDARDVTGDDQSIAGLVKQEFTRLAAELAAVKTWHFCRCTARPDAFYCEKCLMWGIRFDGTTQLTQAEPRPTPGAGDDDAGPKETE